jgi:Tfp pilus assembly protein FimT
MRRKTTLNGQIAAPAARLAVPTKQPTTPKRAARQRGFSAVELAVVVTATLVLAGIATPKATTAIQNFRTGGNARAIANEVAMAKMRAAADFTHARVYADLSAQTIHVDVWDMTNGWVPDPQNGTAISLSTGDTFGYGTSIASAPPNTQSTLGQASACAQTSGTGTVANTACVVFNSRGVPIDSTSTPTGADALYLTDGVSVYGVTVAATGNIQTWRSEYTPSSCSSGRCWKHR